ncbi:hypothetical protein B0H17DRAFT_1139913 [Mycena rosella]|uniref:Uncharacterized protein n=1 Tax=Mycena rosella TaxID=1033263 RepID=A0AAD7D4E7_MYCRO|nr:hypothetical protein B0H17DRAFT_1139913 [Mycena rosella]
MAEQIGRAGSAASHRDPHEPFLSRLRGLGSANLGSEIDDVHPARSGTIDTSSWPYLAFPATTTMPEDRQRFVYKEWVRDPKGKLLDKPPPQGARAPNGVIWGHTLDDFYWIPRIPGVNVLTIWSRSMIQAFGENYLKEKHDEELAPRRLRPYPVLTLPAHLTAASTSPSTSASASTSTSTSASTSISTSTTALIPELGYIDEGCGPCHGLPLQRLADAPPPPKIRPPTPKLNAKPNPRRATPDPAAPHSQAADGKVNPDPNFDSFASVSAVPTAAAADASVPPQETKPSTEGAPPAPKTTTSAGTFFFVASIDELLDAVPAQNVTSLIPIAIEGAATSTSAHADPATPSAAVATSASMTADVPINTVGVGEKEAAPMDVDNKDTKTDALPLTEADAALPPRDTALNAADVAIAAEAMDVDVAAAAPPEGEGTPSPSGSTGWTSDRTEWDAARAEGGAGVTASAEGEAGVKEGTEKADGKIDKIEVEEKEKDGAEAPAMNVDVVGGSKDGVAGADTKEVEDGAKPSTTSTAPGGVDVDVDAAVDSKDGTSAPRFDFPFWVLTPTIGEGKGGNEVETTVADVEKPAPAMEVDVKADGTDAKVPAVASASAPVSDQPVVAVASAVPAPALAAAVDSKSAPTTATPEPPAFHALPKLEEFIPEQYFPDILYVNDPDNSTAIPSYYYPNANKKTPAGRGRREAVPRKYKRVWPRFARDADVEGGTGFNTEEGCASIFLDAPGPTPPSSAYPRVVPPPSTNLRIAHLDLASAPALGVGNHSVVHRAALRLPVPLSASRARSPSGEVTVAAKTGFADGEARRLLANEGKIYGAFPEHLQEAWCGLNLVAPITHPVPVGAVVPKFFGYYVPVREDVEREKRAFIRAWKEKEQKNREERKRKERERKAKAREERRKAEEERQLVEGQIGVPVKPDGDASTVSDDEEDEVHDDADHDAEDEAMGLEYFEHTASYRAWHRMSPILLLEECGSPILPDKFTPDARSECYSLALRLHYAEFTQNSFYVRNILSQPGPLTVAPSARSELTPSFRIIDFGRGEYWPYKLAAAKDANVARRKKTTLNLKARMEVPTEAEMKRRATAEDAEDAADKKALEAAGKTWWETRDYEVRKAHSELKIQDFNY